MSEISNELAEQLLDHGRNGAARFVPLHRGGRGAGSREVPPVIRELIGLSANNGSTIKEVCKEFGVSQSTVSQAKKGNVGVNRHDPELAAKLEETKKDVKASVKDAALDRLAEMFATVITSENLAGISKVREAVVVAKDLATIVEKVTPKQGGNNVAVFIHQPRVKDESEYDSVDVIHVPDAKRID